MPNQFALTDGGSDWWSQQAGRMQTQTAGTPGSPTMPNVYGSQSGALTGGGGPTPGNEQQWFMQLVGNRPWNQQTFNELAPTLQQYGFKTTPPNAVGDQTKIQLPNGHWVRVGFGEGHPVWIPQGDAGGAGLGGAGGGPYTGPGAIPPPFQAPSLSDLQAEPGYQARMAMGQQALERSAAAQGSLLCGGTQKSLNRYAQDYASGEYGAAYDMVFRKYQENFLTQSQDPWNRYRDLYAGGLSAGQSTKTSVPLYGG